MRRYDLDALRVIAFGLLIFYHAGMFFVPWDFHIKNNITYQGLVLPMLFFNQWRLPLLFVISGMGTWFAFSRRNSRQFATERFRRLGIPLLFGMIFIVPPQIYMERLVGEQFHGSYLRFWPLEAFKGGIYPEGNISWHHLWFILYLLIFSLSLLPLLQYLCKHTQDRVLNTLRRVVGKPAALYIFVVPLTLWRVWLAPRFPQTNALVNDWYGLAHYGTLFLSGFLLIALKDVFWHNVTRFRRYYLSAGLVSFAGLVCLRSFIPDFPGHIYVVSLVRMINMWSWIWVLMGYAAVYLNKPGKWLAYANEAVYPFYILHQSVMLVLCYYLRTWPLDFVVKFALLCAGTFAITWIIYETCIRRWRVPRMLFGMKAMC